MPLKAFLTVEKNITKAGLNLSNVIEIAVYEYNSANLQHSAYLL